MLRQWLLQPSTWVLGAVVAMVYYLWRTLMSTPSVAKKQTINVHLSKLSDIWRYDPSKKRRVTDLAHLKPIWRVEQGEREELESDESFTHPRLTDFYVRHIQSAPYFRSQKPYRDVCVEILRMLDAEGDASSVVNVKNDYEAANLLKNSKQSYDLLSQVSLLNHSLNVAEEMVRALGDQQLIIPAALITALGHDLGKTPSAQGELYRTGNHPIVSVSVLHTLPGFVDLPRNNDISTAVANHHSKADGLLGQTLSKCDMAARKHELAALNERMMKTRAEALQKKPAEAPPVPEAVAAAPADTYRIRESAEKAQAAKAPAAPAPEAALDLLPGVEETPAPAATEAQAPAAPAPEAALDLLPGVEEPSAAPGTPAAAEADLDLLPGVEEPPAAPTATAEKPAAKATTSQREMAPIGALYGMEASSASAEEAPKGPAERPKASDASGFDLDRILAAMAAEVNRCEGPRFRAFTMVGGVTYAQVGLLMDIAREQAREHGDLSFDMLDDDQMRLGVLLGIVERLRQEKEAIAEELLPKGYIGAHFSLAWADRKTSTKPSYYLPLRTAALGDVAELEGRKGEKLQKILSVSSCAPPEGR